MDVFTLNGGTELLLDEGRAESRIIIKLDASGGISSNPNTGDVWTDLLILSGTLRMLAFVFVKKRRPQH